jgi:two-component system, sporulation sensor kinase E
MRKIPVTREGKKGSEILLIPSDDIVKIECIRDKEYMIHTLDDAYYYSSSLDAFEELLYEDGFRLIDQTNLVNLNYVRQYDSNKGIVRLEDPSNSNYKTASAARIHKDHILNVMEMIRITNIEKDQGFPCGSDLEDKLKQMVAISQDDRFMRSYAMIQAIYERTRAEKLLEESEQRYKSLHENNPDAICSFDLLGQFISVNPATERITGYPADELLHKSIMQMILPSDIEHCTRHFQKAIQGETQTYEITFIHKNGFPVNLEVINVPIVVNDKIAGVYAISKDITEKKHAEYLLIKSEKLSIVGQLAAGVAHEIRNPLTSLKGFVQLLKGRTQDNNQFFDIMLSELDRINFIVSEFLVIAKPQVVQFELRDINNILNSTIAFLNTQAILRNVEIISFIQEEFPPILCDENQIKQVFINVLNNSIDAMPDGGEIIIKARLNERGGIVMTFIDQGVGIPDERISRLGEPFYTTKEKGTGLGLMVSYKIIENHNGHLNIQSKVGKGTVVSIILPTLQQTP